MAFLTYTPDETALRLAKAEVFRLSTEEIMIVNELKKLDEERETVEAEFQEREDELEKQLSTVQARLCFVHVEVKKLTEEIDGDEAWKKLKVGQEFYFPKELTVGIRRFKLDSNRYIFTTETGSMVHTRDQVRDAIQERFATLREGSRPSCI